MTNRLTDDEIKDLRQRTEPVPFGEQMISASWLTIQTKTVARLLDEIEERRRWAVAASRVVVWARALANDPNACVEDLAAAVQELNDAECKDGGA